MKSQFILAFNEICESRGLPKEDVFEALKTALVSAYRRDANVSNTQKVTVDIDPRTGDPTIYAEKEVVDSIIDNRTEVLLEEAHRQGLVDAELGDLVMVDSTTSSFGRIAAQTAKQVLLQRVREAEREHLFEDFSGREGELVNGTVQSISGQHITIGLGRTEAILPKSQQVPRERYRAHDKIRVYVLEVRRTNRGPQIFVSRNHRNLLRRLLELEVPEIYNGQVEVMSIAREAGQRSKVAVRALQPGVDPVGACVGMRGVRIQSIVRELNDEKIDVIEWDPDQRAFISKALSPARVSKVFLEEDLENGKTAVVIVPDDQLSLAIGREGQNARLAAKLTGWRIDIKSLTEAAADSLGMLGNPAADRRVVRDEAFLNLVRDVLEKKKAGRPITSEDYYNLDKLVTAVEGRIIASRASKFDEVRKKRADARRQVPAETWKSPLDELDLPGRVHNLLLDNEIETIGDVLFHLEMGDEVLLAFNGIGDKGLEIIKEHVANYKETHQLEMPEPVPVVPKPAAPKPKPEPAPVIDLLDNIVESAAGLLGDEDEDEELEAVESVAETAVVEEVVEDVVETAVEEDIDEDAEPEAAEPVQPEPAEEELVPLSPIEDLSRSLVEVEEPKPVKSKKKKQVVIVRPVETTTTDDDDSKTGRGRQKGRQLVFDEDMGEVVTKRKRKGSRRRSDWDEFELDDY
ncbi:MAG: transcription termination factor NusA [Chloroflexota bacterium]